MRKKVLTDRLQFNDEQGQQVELGLFRIIFWGGEKPEDIRINSYQFKGAEMYYFVVFNQSFLSPNEVRVLT